MSMGLAERQRPFIAVGQVRVMQLCRLSIPAPVSDGHGLPDLGPLARNVAGPVAT